MLKILFISGANKEFDGRTRELESVLKKIGDVTSLTPMSEKTTDDDIIVKNPEKGYFSFLRSISAACGNIMDFDQSGQC